MDFDNIIADKQLWLGKHYTSGRDGRSVEGVAVHYNDGNLTHEQCFNTWNGEREASAHFDADESGSVCQYVHEADTAWAVGDWDGNCKTISIEHGNYADGTISDACLDAGAHLVAALCKKYGLGRPQWDVNVFPHSHYSATSCPGQIYGLQKDAYIQRAQAWYDSMTGGTAASSGPAAPSQPSEPAKGPIGPALLLDCDAGIKTWSEWAKQLGLSGSDADGYINYQYTGNKKYLKNVSSAIYAWYKGCPGSPTVKAIQRRIGSKNIDGVWGAVDTENLKAYMKKQWGYKMTTDGYGVFGDNTAYNVQHSLNQGFWRQ